MPGLEPDLCAREAQRNEAGCRVRLVAAPVLSLLRRRAVVAEVVSLDDEPELGPVEVDAVAVHVRLREW
jgi:hypothetical protein